MCISTSFRQDNVKGEVEVSTTRSNKKNYTSLCQKMNSYHSPPAPNSKLHPNTRPLTLSPDLEIIFIIPIPA